NVPLYINKKDQFLVDRLGETAQYFLNYKPIIFPILKFKNLEFNNLLKIKNFKLKILKVYAILLTKF
ncbi:MAG: hypothetical protein ACP5O8_03880, partial [Candidatus Aenigmatarchaeota archaeon]